MRWEILKSRLCPQCSYRLQKNARGNGYMCKCGFFITIGKFDAIVNKYNSTHNKEEGPPEQLNYPEIFIENALLEYNNLEL